jgi:glucose-1-phosphate cytidylyltransferase
MKAVILAGGFGTRLSEETVTKPKPMVEIGNKPILWHIMKHYSYFGVNEFIICLGYKGYMIKEYFANYLLHNCDVTLNFKTGVSEYHTRLHENWKVSLVDTGADTMTGGRIKRIQKYVEGETSFCLTYGDGLADIDIREQIKFHESHGKQATLLAVPSPGRFGALTLKNDQITGFAEKPERDGNYINGGFFVLSPKVLSTISGDASIWEREPLETLTKKGELRAIKHDGFWQCMDTLRDKMLLDKLWASGEAPWKGWQE